MATIDERVVAMSFENTKFEASVATTMGTLSKLDQAIRNIGQTSGLSNIEKDASKVTLTGPMTALDKLKAKLSFSREGPAAFNELENSGNKVAFTGPSSALDKLKQKLGFPEAPQAFANLEASSDKVSFSGVSRAMDGLKSGFSVLQGAAAVAFGQIGTMAIQKIGGALRSISIGPLVQGFQEYSTNLNSIQTILANTQDSGGNLQTVNAALQDLNRYSDRTIYNFGQMARNIGTFTAAGVRLGPATQAIKGIANLAALSGSNAEQASTAMYQLSQAIAAGHVSLQDWNSVVNAGMGGAVFQKALIRTGQAMGTISDGAVKIDKATGHATINGNSFRESITAKPGEKSWLTSDVLTKTLAQFTGDLTTAQLKAQGFNDQQIKAIQRTATTAQHAATEVKTIGGVFDVVKESIGSGWSSVFQIILGNFEESKKTFTDLSNFLQGGVSRAFKALTSVLTEWKKLGGRTEFIAGIKQAFEDLMRILRPIKDAFRDIFPAKTGQDLFNMTKNFHDLMETLRPSDETMRNLRRTFEGIFAVLHIGWTIVKDIAKEFFHLFGVVGKGSGGFLNLTGTIGDFLKNLDSALTKGGLLTGFFSELDPLVRIAAKLIKAVAIEITNLFTGLSPGKLITFASSMDDMKKQAGPLVPVLDGVSKAWDTFLHIVDRVKEKVGPIFKQIGEVIANFGKFVGDAIAHADYSAVFAGINTVLLGGIFLTIRKAIGGGLKLDFGGGVIKNISGMFEMLTGNLKAMQQNVQAKTLLAIAAALGILAGAIFILSTVDSKKLASSMTALAVGMGELVGAMAILNKAAGGTAFLRMPFIASSMVILAGAIILMAGAVKIFASMSWGEMVKGLIGVAGSLTAISAATKFMAGPQLESIAFTLLPIAAALKLLASAVKDFSALSWGQMIKGLVGTTGALTGIGLAMRTFPPNIGLQALSLIAISFALAMLSGAVASFGAMNLEHLLRGLFGLAASLVAIGSAIEFIPPTIAIQAAGLTLLAIALTGIAGVVSAFGHMAIGTIVKGIIAMGGALVVLGVGLEAMSGTLLGSAALLAAAAAFALLAPAIGLMGTLPWSVITKGLITIAATLGVLAVVGAAAAEPIALLGLALIPLGIGMAAIGAAVYLFAKGISLLSGTAVKAFATLLAAAGVFIAAFPTLVINFIKGILQVLQSIADLAPKIVTALVTIVNQLLDAIIKLAPKMGEAISALITQMLNVLNANAGPIIQAGFGLLLNLLKGLADNMGKVTEQVIAIITTFIQTLGDHAADLVNAGATALIRFLSGITQNLPRLISTVATLITTFLNNVAKHIPEIVQSGYKIVIGFINGIANSIGNVVKAGINLIVKFLEGVANAVPRIVKAAGDIADKFITALGKGLLRIVNLAFRTLINFLNGLADSIRKNEPALWRAGFNVASAIIEGMVRGLWQLAPHVWSVVQSIINKIPHAVRKLLGIGSPSKVFHEIGQNIMQGLGAGISNAGPKATANLIAQVKEMIAFAQAHMDEIQRGEVPGFVAAPIIKPVLDLTQVKKDAKNIGPILPHLPTTAMTFTAEGALTGIRPPTEAEIYQFLGRGPKEPPQINFHQNNYSPESLSNAEIYRLTQNQLSQARHGLNINLGSTRMTPVSVG